MNSDFAKLMQRPSNSGVSSPENASNDNVLDIINAKEQFAMCLAALRLESVEEFENFLAVQSYIMELDLTGYVNSSLKNPLEMWGVVSQFLDWSVEELHEQLSGLESSRTTDYFRAVRDQLWLCGIRSYSIGFLQSPPKLGVSALDSILQELESYKSSAALWKINAMENAYKSLNKLFPMNFAGTGARQIRESVHHFLEEFSQGRLVCTLKGTFKPPKEMGIVLAHTMPPQEWIAKHLTLLFRKLCNMDEVYVLFRRENADVSAFKQSKSDYALVDFDDDNSPYNLDHHPSFGDDDYDLDDHWHWRSEVSRSVKQVAARMDNEEDLNSEVTKLLSSYASENFDTSGFEAVSPFLLAKGNSLFFRVYRRGYSKLEDVKSNKSYLHVVSVAVAQSISANHYVKVLLPDCSSVLLLPADFWMNIGKNESVFHPYGTLVHKLNIDGVRLIVFLCQFAMTHQFIASLSSGAKFDIDKVVTNLSNVVSSSSGLRKIKGWGSSNQTEKQSFLENVLGQAKEASYGLVATAEKSKVGSRTRSKIEENTGFMQFSAPVAPEDDNSGEQNYFATIFRKNTGGDSKRPLVIQSSSVQDQTSTDVSLNGISFGSTSITVDDYLEDT